MLLPELAAAAAATVEYALFELPEFGFMSILVV